MLRSDCWYSLVVLLRDELSWIAMTPCCESDESTRTVECAVCSGMYSGDVGLMFSIRVSISVIKRRVRSIESRRNDNAICENVRSKWNKQDDKKRERPRLNAGSLPRVALIPLWKSHAVVALTPTLIDVALMSPADAPGC
jgi:hypothetical protein